MNNSRNWIVAIAAVAVVAVGTGYWIGRSHESAAIDQPAAASPPAAAPVARTPIYYQDPDGKAEYSPSPKKTADGRDYKPVYDENAGANTSSASSAPEGRVKILYYRNPMGLADTSPVPKKDSMGMDYIPVYENDAGSDANTVTVSPARVQMLGVRTEAVAMRPSALRTIRATGALQFDERRLATVTTKVAGWIEQLHVAATGEPVRAGQPLLEMYSPDLVSAEQEYLVVAQMAVGTAHGDDRIMLDAARRRLRALGVPDAEIARLERSGKAARVIAVLAPASGVVTEKNAVLGMKVDPGMPLYKTADLSSVWLIADVQEQDLGKIRAGQAADATFVAFPGRGFPGQVDFIYPSLSTETRTAKVRIIVPNRDLLLRPGMYATVEIRLGEDRAAPILAVPNSAIIDSGSRQVVLVAKGEGRFEPRVVRLGARGDGYSEVLAGVKKGEQVVTSANFLIDAESNLKAALQAFTSGADQK